MRLALSALITTTSLCANLSRAQASPSASKAGSWVSGTFEVVSVKPVVINCYNKDKSGKRRTVELPVCTVVLKHLKGESSLNKPGFNSEATEVYGHAEACGYKPTQKLELKIIESTSEPLCGGLDCTDSIPPKPVAKEISEDRGYCFSKAKWKILNSN